MKFYFIPVALLFDCAEPGNRPHWDLSHHPDGAGRHSLCHPCPAWSPPVSALVTALGWVGAVTCLIAYVMVTRGRWTASSGRYQLANVISGLFMGMVAARSGVWPSAVTNLVWMAVGVHAVAVLLQARRRRLAENASITAEAVTDAAAPGGPAAVAVTAAPSLPTQSSAVVDLAA